MTKFHRLSAIMIAAALSVSAISTGTDAFAAEVRDHRSKPEVRDHRTQPVVRDHRSQRVVRDHRSPKNSNRDVSNSPGGVKVTTSPGGSRGCRAQVCATGRERPGRGRWQPN